MLRHFNKMLVTLMTKKSKKQTRKTNDTYLVNNVLKEFFIFQNKILRFKNFSLCSL